MFKDFHLCILTPTTGFVRIAFAVSLYQLTCSFLATKVCEGNQSFNFMAVEGSGVGANREKLVDIASEATHILFVDEDMGFEPEALYLLMRHQLSIVGCNYKVKIENGNFMAMDLDGKRVTLNETKTGVEQVYYTGFGFCLIEKDIFSKIEKPWFLPAYKNGEYTTEDSGFAARASEAGIRWYVDHDASKLVYHVGSKNYTWKVN